MPKEIVYGEDHGIDNGRSQVEVRWDREAGDVSLVTKCVDPIDGGRLIKEDEGIHYTDGFHVQVDRRAINRLISNLRRARDQAFGRDE